MPAQGESYSLDSLTEQTGVSKRTIRYYVATGMIPPPSGAGRGARYGAEHLARLQAIGAVKRNYHLPNSAIRRGLEEAASAGAMSAEAVLGSARTAALASYAGETVGYVQDSGNGAEPTMRISFGNPPVAPVVASDSGADYARRVMKTFGEPRPEPFTIPEPWHPEPWAPQPAEPWYPGISGPSTPWTPPVPAPYSPFTSPHPPFAPVPTAPPVPNVPSSPGVPAAPTSIPFIPANPQGGVPYPPPPSPVPPFQPATYPVPPYQGGTAGRSTWDRVTLGPDFELQVRRPLTREGNRALPRVIEAIQRILDEEGAR